MVNNSVIIKSNRYGLVVILDDEIPFDELLSEVDQKFKKAAKFFKNAEMAVSFEGRTLTKDEEKEIIHTITNSSGIHIICVVDLNKETEQLFKQAIEEQADKTAKKEKPPEKDGQFYKGTLRSGQVIEAETSIIILGDVNPGANVISKGNVIVLGTCAGTIHAGAAGNLHSFVAALSMNPIQIRIGDYMAKRPSAKKNNEKEKDFTMAPKIAFVQNERICLQPIEKDVLGDFYL